MAGSKIFLLICLSFIGGIFLSSFLPAVALAKAGLAILGIIFISIFWGRWNLTVIGLCILFLVLGIWRHEFAKSKIIYPEEENIVFSGIVAAEPDIRAANIKLIVKSDGNGSRPIAGKVLLTTDRYPEYQYGDRLKISGKLQAPAEFEDFNYKDYLAKEGIYSVAYYPEIELLETGKYTAVGRLYAGILGFKNKLREVIFQNLSSPQSSILGAIMLGDKRQISDEWKEKLNYAGLRHLTAVSGMHVAVLTIILMNFLIALGFWRRQAFYFTAVLIALFIIMVGFQPSAVRAGLMAGFFLLAQHLGRLNVSARTVILAASLMLFQNPLLLKSDVGFQLSFLAVFGIIYLLPVFRDSLRCLPDFCRLRDILAVTLSAQIFTLPILIYNFGYFSLAGIAANILVVPFLPLIMGLGIIFILGGLINGYLGWFFSLPVWFLLRYLTTVVDWFSGLSFSVYFFEISWFWFLLFYLFLVVFVRQWREKRRLEFLKY